jgi:hypothetical protein
VTGTPVIERITLKMIDRDADIIKPHMEDMGREAFRNRFGREPDRTEWYWDAGGDWLDEETGETYAVPPMWMLVVEGVKSCGTGSAAP